MEEIHEVFAIIVKAFKQPDFFILGAMFVIAIIGFACGIAVAELIRVKNEIRTRRLHKKRRDPWMD